MYLYGASGHAKVIIEILEKCGLKIDGIFDDNHSIKCLLDYPVQTYKCNLIIGAKTIISIGNNHLRKKISKLYTFEFDTLIHPSSTISKRIRIGVGTVIMGNSIINSGTKIGKHVIINTSASVDHDCNIADFVHISPNATLCGNIKVDEGTHIGASAVIIPSINIGKWVIIGAGSVIINDVPDYATVVGNPGVIIKIAKPNNI